MRRFRFSLEELLELRRFKARQSELALAEKAGRVRLAEMELERVALEEARTRSGRFGPARGIMDFIADERYLQRLSRERQRGLEDLAARQVEREKALEAWREASKAEKALEAMEDGELEAYRKEAGRREIMEIDDIVSGKRARTALAVPPASEARHG